MSLNVRIFLAFTLMAGIVAAIAGLGLSNSISSKNALEKVITVDLPAEDRLGRVGRYMEEIRSDMNYRLNPSLTADDRKTGREKYNDHLSTLKAVKVDFGEKIQILTSVPFPQAAELAKKWSDLQAAQEPWLKTLDELFAIFDEWDQTKILNPRDLLGNIQQYRGDHYNLVRRMAEMLVKGQVSGAEVGSSDTVCAFGHWRADYDQINDSEKNPVIKKTLEEIRPHHKNFHANAAALYQNIKAGRGDDPRSRELFIQLLSEADGVVKNFTFIIDEAARVVALYQKATDLVQGRQLAEYKQVSASFEALLDIKTVFDDWDKGLVINSGLRGVKFLKWGLALALLLSVILAVMVGRSIGSLLTGPLNRVIDALDVNAEELAELASDLARTSDALSGGADTQVASLTDSAAAVEEMSAMTSKNAESSQQASRMMHENAAHVQEGFTTMAQMEKAMEGIKQSSEQIGRIIKTIEDIAFQTNILALNAAVEAARAGEAGQGFAVVADEVRGLAQRSAQASHDTRVLIEDTVNRVASGHTLTKSIEDFFEQFTSSTKEAGQIIDDISQATAEQAKGMSQVNNSMQMIDKVAKETLDNARNAATASRALNQRSDDLNEAVQGLGRIIGHSPRPQHASSEFKSLPRVTSDD